VHLITVSRQAGGVPVQTLNCFVRGIAGAALGAALLRDAKRSALWLQNPE
jgi:hypothetical protein